MAGVVVLDAGALIALYNSDDLHHKWAMSMFIDTVAAQLEMSALTLAEVMVHPTKAGKVKQFEKGISGLGIKVSGIEAKDAPEIANLRASTGLKMPDVIVLHQAILSSATLATTDKALADVAKSYLSRVLKPN